MAKMDHSTRKHGFKMLATDYVNYDISYDCKSFWGIFHASNLAITSREMKMSEEIQQKVRKVIKDKIPEYILTDGMYWTMQGKDRCQYYWMSDNQGMVFNQYLEDEKVELVQNEEVIIEKNTTETVEKVIETTAEIMDETTVEY